MSKQKNTYLGILTLLVVLSFTLLAGKAQARSRLQNESLDLVNTVINPSDGMLANWVIDRSFKSDEVPESLSVDNRWEVLETTRVADYHFERRYTNNTIADPYDSAINRAQSWRGDFATSSPYIRSYAPAATTSWHTYNGGSGDDYGYAITMDSSDNIYVAGRTNASWGTPIRSYTSGIEAFAAKYDNSGNLIWHTFLGNTGDDYGMGIALDGSGNVYVLG